MTVFETETMAELCVKQGLVSEALSIYRRLVADAPDEGARARRGARLSELERIARGVVAARTGGASGPVVAAADGVSLALVRRADALHFTWRLPPETQRPALQLLLLRRGPAGIEAETRTVPLDGASGQTTIEAPGLYGVRAAAGWLDGSRFVPVTRLPAEGL